MEPINLLTFKMNKSLQSLLKDLNATVEYTTVVTKTNTKQQIILTYNEQRRCNGRDDSQQSS